MLSRRIFKLHLKIVEHVLKYVTHHMLSTVLKYALRIFELPGPGVTRKAINLLQNQYWSVNGSLVRERLESAGACVDSHVKFS